MGTIIVLYKMEFRWKIGGGEFKKEWAMKKNREIGGGNKKKKIETWKAQGKERCQPNGRVQDEMRSSRANRQGEG
jgi:hypothetical protein